jgi:hypothetical protein
MMIGVQRQCKTLSRSLHSRDGFAPAPPVLRARMLFPRLYFKKHGALYYELRNEVRLRGEWGRCAGARNRLIII